MAAAKMLHSVFLSRPEPLFAVLGRPAHGGDDGGLRVAPRLLLLPFRAAHMGSCRLELLSEEIKASGAGSWVLRFWIAGFRVWGSTQLPRESCGRAFP